MSEIKTVAISICTYKRPNQLREALKTVKLLKIPTDLTARLHVIDNDPTEEVKGIFFEETQGVGFDCSYVEEPRRGLVFARNRALEEASMEGCDLIAFFDDDDNPDQDWLINLWECMKGYEATVVSGKMVFEWPESVTLSEDVKRIYDGALDHIKSGDLMTTCGSGNTLIDNQFIQKNNLQFNEIFNLTGGEDSHFFELMNKIGAKIVRCNEAIVYSDIIAGRATEDFIWSRRYNIGYVGYIKDVLIKGKRKANAKFIRKIFKILRKLFYSIFSSSPDLKMKKKQRMVEMRGMIDAFRGIKYEGYRSTDGH